MTNRMFDSKPQQYGASCQKTNNNEDKERKAKSKGQFTALRLWSGRRFQNNTRSIWCERGKNKMKLDWMLSRAKKSGNIFKIHFLSITFAAVISSPYCVHLSASADTAYCQAVIQVAQPRATYQLSPSLPIIPYYSETITPHKHMLSLLSSVIAHRLTLQSFPESFFCFVSTSCHKALTSFQGSRDRMRIHRGL